MMLRKWSTQPEIERTRMPEFYSGCEQHLWDIFCIHWVTISHALIIGRE